MAAAWGESIHLHQQSIIRAALRVAWRHSWGRESGADDAAKIESDSAGSARELLRDVPKSTRWAGPESRRDLLDDGCAECREKSRGGWALFAVAISIGD